MRLLRKSLRKPRYNIYFYHDLEVRYEINGDRPWIMLGYLMSGFALKDLRPTWQIGRLQAQINSQVNYTELLKHKEKEFTLERVLENVFH